MKRITMMVAVALAVTGCRANDKQPEPQPTSKPGAVAPKQGEDAHDHEEDNRAKLTAPNRARTRTQRKKSTKARRDTPTARTETPTATKK